MIDRFESMIDSAIESVIESAGTGVMLVRLNWIKIERVSAGIRELSLLGELFDQQGIL